MSRTINVGGNQGRGDPPLSRVAIDLRGWWLEFDNDGAPVIWHGEAADEKTAETCARNELARKHADFDREGARLVACIER